MQAGLYPALAAIVFCILAAHVAVQEGNSAISRCGQLSDISAIATIGKNKIYFAYKSRSVSYLHGKYAAGIIGGADVNIWEIISCDCLLLG